MKYSHAYIIRLNVSECKISKVLSLRQTKYIKLKVSSPFQNREYPYQQLFDLFAGIKYNGWILLEARTEPADKIAILKEQLKHFNQLVDNSKKI